jgi:phosphorylcholine metabolism protein LicD
MSGSNTTKEKLNHTLKMVCDVLHDNHINDWFVFFGTMLGIVRENSCIEGDDDIDIMICCDYTKLRTIFENKGFTFTTDFGINDSKEILKSVPRDEYGSFDFYMCNINESGDWCTPWHGVTSTNSYVDPVKKDLIRKEWNSTTLNLPNDYERKLVNMYGDNWRIPQSKSCKWKLGAV